MKRFARVPAPDRWETEGLAAGRAWLGKNPHNPAKGRPHDLWSPHRDHLAAGFGDLCGYTLMCEPTGTVDHFISWSQLRGTADAWRAYDWDNFRYSVAWFNSSRRGPIPDPYLVEESWFELRLPGLELLVTDAVPMTERPAVDNVMRWLRKDRRVMKARQMWYRLYQDGKLSLAGLEQMAPLIAAALRRQPDYLLPADQARLQAGAL